MFSLYANYYYIVLGLQAICALHCIRKGNQNKWIWLIIFLPLIGCLAYIFTEIFTRHELEQVQSGVGAVFNPTGKIKALQERLRFTDTFNNRIELADAYLDVGQSEKAISLYEESLTGTFVDNEHGNMQLIKAYFAARRYEDVVRIGRKITHLPQFNRSRAHMLYAMALGYTGQKEAAEKEFGCMKGRFSNYECRYNYGIFLKMDMRPFEAREMFTEMVREADHLSPNERRMNKTWITNAKEQLKAMATEVTIKKQ